jgi:hypothetical protein
MHLKQVSFAIFILLGLCLFAFENCAKMKSSHNSLSSLSNGSGGTASNPGTLITNPPTNPADPLNVVVGDSNTILNGSAVVSFKLNKANPADIQIHWLTADGTAVEANEYVASSGVLTIPAGNLTGTANIAILHSETFDVSFNVQINSVSSGAIGRALATIVIPANSVKVVLKNLWKPMSMTGAPSQRVWHSAVWTGSRMIVFGGSALNANGNPVGNPLNDGGSYDPLTDM